MENIQSKSKNILIISSVFPPYNKWWGQSQVAYDYAKWLRNNWFNISVLTHQFWWLSKTETIESIKITRFQNYFQFLFNIWLYNPKKYIDCLRNHIREFDLVFIHDIYTLYWFLSAFFAKKNNIPYIFMPHWMWSLKNQTEKVFFKKIFIVLFSNFISNNAKKVIFCSQNEKDNYSLKYRDYEIVTNGIKKDIWLENLATISEENKTEFRKRYQIENKKVIFSMWRLVKAKRFDLLIQYIKNFLTKNPDYLLLIVWPDWWEKENIQNIIIKENLINNIKIIDWLYNKEKYTLFKIWELFILASDIEGFPIVVCEAIISNIPCLLSKWCNIEEKWWYIEIFINELDFNKKLSLLLQNKTKIGFKKIYNDFDFSISLKKLLKIIKNII